MCNSKAVEYLHFSSPTVIFTINTYCIYHHILLLHLFGPIQHTVLRSQYDDLLSKNFKKTIGQLLHKIKEVITVPDELTAEVEEALKRRNFLMHNYFWERAVQFTTSAGQQAMIHELQDACALFQKVDSYFEAITKEWGKKYGVTEAHYANELEKLLKHEP